jgi:hypothetical protein
MTDNYQPSGSLVITSIMFAALRRECESADVTAQHAQVIV